MSGIDNIVNKIKEENQARLDAMQAETNAKIAEINNAAQTQLDNELAAMKSTTDDEVATIRSNAIVSAESGCRKQQLAIKTEMMSKAFDGALAKMKGFSDSDKKDYAKKLVLAYASGEENFVASDAAYTDGFISELNAALTEKGKAGNLKLVKSENQMEGFMLQRDGIVLDMQYDSVIEDLKNTIDIDVAKILFEV